MSPGGGCGTRPGAAAPSGSKPFLQLLCSGGVTPAAPWGALGRLRTRSHRPWGCLVGVGGSEVVPISRHNPKARSPQKGNLSPPGCLHLKAAFCTLLKSRLCVCFVCVFGAQSSLQRHCGAALGIGGAEPFQKCWDPNGSGGRRGFCVK